MGTAGCWRCSGTLRSHDYGSDLARDLEYTPLYLHYSSGLHISVNGQTFADLQQTPVENWPADLEDLMIIAHSAGGLLSRGACHCGAIAGHQWLRHLRYLSFIGTPHHGAPLEQWGNLVMSDWTWIHFGPRVTRSVRTFAGHADKSALLTGVRCYAIAATKEKRKASLLRRSIGDGIVPLDSALGRHQHPAMTVRFAQSRLWIGYKMNHWYLLCRPAVCHVSGGGWRVSERGCSCPYDTEPRSTDLYAFAPSQ